MLCTTLIDYHRAPMLVGSPGNCPSCACVKMALVIKRNPLLTEPNQWWDPDKLSYMNTCLSSAGNQGALRLSCNNKKEWKALIRF
jgi:hypothetical protein